MIEIPLNSSPEQIFSVTINGETYNIRVILNSRTGIWTIDISKPNEILVTGVPLLAGIDILKQYTIPINNAYVVNLEKSNLDPEKEGLGTISKLFILIDEEIENG